MRVWINKGSETIVTGGETFPPGEWLRKDDTWGCPYHPDIVEAWAYVQEKINEAKADVPTTVDANGDFVEDAKFQEALAVKLKEQGVDAMVTALETANKDYGVKPYTGSTYVTSVLATADAAAEEAAKG